MYPLPPLPLNTQESDPSPHPPCLKIDTGLIFVFYYSRPKILIWLLATMSRRLISLDYDVFLRDTIAKVGKKT